MRWWDAALAREQRRLLVYRVSLGAALLVLVVAAGALIVYLFDGCKFPGGGYQGCCAQVVLGQQSCTSETGVLQCCYLSGGLNCTTAPAEEGKCTAPRTDDATTAMALAITGILVSYLVVSIAWPLYVYTSQQAIHPLFVRIARTASEDTPPDDVAALVADINKNAAFEIVGILPPDVRLAVDRTTQEALHEPLRVVLPTLLWAWLSPQGHQFLDTWSSRGTRVGKRTSGRILFLSAALNRADLLRVIVTARLTDANISVLNTGCDISFADLEPVPWRIALQALITAGVVNILAPISALNSTPDQYPQRMPPPLIVATVLGHLDVVVALLEMRANPSITFVGGMTPLHYAAKFGFGEIAKMLIFSGASAETRSTAGTTPMDLASNADVQVIMRAALAAKRKVDQAARDTALSPIESEALLLFGEMRLTERTNADTLKGTFRGMSVAVQARAAPREAHKTILTEAAVLRTLAHANLLALYGVALGPEDKRLYFLQEPIEADTLLDYIRQRARRGQALTLTLKRQVAAQIADGIACLHGSGLLHRHVAARNVLAVRPPTPSAPIVPKIINVSLGDQPTSADVSWTAPESLQDPAKHVSASDAWSFGVLYWELLTDGLVPFGTAQPSDVRERILGGEVLSRVPNTPSDDTMIMMDCWQTDPDLRPTFKQLRRRLEQLQSSTSIPRPQASPTKAARGARASSAPASETSPLLVRQYSGSSLDD